MNRSLSEGRAAGLASVSGVVFGNFVNSVGASIGLVTLFALSSAAFVVVEYAGAAYLVTLGVRALRRREAPAVATALAPSPHGRSLRDGFFVAVLNPKTTLFFAAFLPQFLHAETATASRNILLGAPFVAIAAVTASLYALASGTSPDGRSSVSDCRARSAAHVSNGRTTRTTRGSDAVGRRVVSLRCKRLNARTEAFRRILRLVEGPPRGRSVEAGPLRPAVSTDWGARDTVTTRTH